MWVTVCQDPTWGLAVGKGPILWPPKGPNEYDRVPRSTETKLTTTLPKVYRAPSWSWASLDAWVGWASYPSTAAKFTEGVIELLDVSFQFEGGSIYGKMTDGHLTLMAVYMEVYMSCLAPETREQIRSFLSTVDCYECLKDQFLHVIHDEVGAFALAAFDLLSVPPGKLYALKLTHPAPPLTMDRLSSGLLLRESERRPGAYERVGLFMILEEAHLRAFADIRPGPITLV